MLLEKKYYCVESTLLIIIPKRGSLQGGADYWLGKLVGPHFIFSYYWRGWGGGVFLFSNEII